MTDEVKKFIEGVGAAAETIATFYKVLMDCGIPEPTAYAMTMGLLQLIIHSK